MPLSVQDFARSEPGFVDASQQLLKGLNAREQFQNKPFRQQAIQQDLALGEQQQQINAQKMQAFQQQQAQAAQKQQAALQQKARNDQLESELDVFAKTMPDLESMLRLAPVKKPGERLPEGDAARALNAKTQKAQGQALWFKLKAMADAPGVSPELRASILDTAKDVKDKILNEADPDIRKSNIQGIVNFGKNIRKKLEAEGIIKPVERGDSALGFAKLEEKKLDRKRKEDKLSSEVTKFLLATNKLTSEADTNIIKFETLADLVLENVTEAGVFRTGVEWLKRLRGGEDIQTKLLTEFASITFKDAVNNLPPGAASDRDVKLALKGVPTDTVNAQGMADYLRALANVNKAIAKENRFTLSHFDSGGTVTNLQAAKDLFFARDQQTGEPLSPGGNRPVADLNPDEVLQELLNSLKKPR